MKKRKASSWFFYVLACGDGTLYSGITIDPARRLMQHNKGIAARYTRGRLPVKMVHLETCRSRSHALKKEYAVKSLSRTEKENYIREKGITTKAPRHTERYNVSP